MKERIEKKLNENIEKILKKDELDRYDVAILKDEYARLKNDEELSASKIKTVELAKKMSETLM